MTIQETGFDGLIELVPTLFQDSRGWFCESYKDETFKKFGINYQFRQENQSFSKKGVVRGLHFQRAPHAQAKLVTALTGKVLDVVVDLRPDSKTFKKVYTCLLDSEKRNMLMVPDGFAHGFSALEDAHFLYKCSDVYHKESEGGILWNDPQLNIDWRVENPIVSDKDVQLPTLEEYLRNSLISR